MHRNNLRHDGVLKRVMAKSCSFSVGPARRKGHTRRGCAAQEMNDGSALRQSAVQVLSQISHHGTPFSQSPCSSRDHPSPLRATSRRRATHHRVVLPPHVARHRQQQQPLHPLRDKRSTVVRAARADRAKTCLSLLRSNRQPNWKSAWSPSLHRAKEARNTAAWSQAAARACVRSGAKQPCPADGCAESLERDWPT